MARKPKVEPVNDDRQKLLTALAFAGVTIEKADEGKTSFVSFRDRWLMAANDTITISTPVDIDLELCPQADKFEAALKQCGQQYQLTQIEANAVSIKSGDFRAMIAALPLDLFEPCTPDLPCAAISDRLNIAMETCAKVMSNKGDRAFNKSLLLRANSVVGTNGGLVIESWHGIDLPGEFPIPNKAIEAILKINKPLCQFGFSENSVTFYFDNGAWLKTRLISTPWPNLDRLLNLPTALYEPIWPEFFVALKAIDAFVQDDTVYFHNDVLATHRVIGIGASYRVAGLPGDRSFGVGNLRIVEPFVTHIAMGADRTTPAAFVGENVRGLIVGKTL